MDEKDKKVKNKSVTIEVLMEGPNGELFFQPVEATPENVEELIKKTTNSMIKRNLEKQLEKMKKGINLKENSEGQDTH